MFVDWRITEPSVPTQPLSQPLLTKGSCCLAHHVPRPYQQPVSNTLNRLACYRMGRPKTFQWKYGWVIERRSVIAGEPEIFNHCLQLTLGL